jgi:RimJ/RimL family protein N-acetyltransferase
MMQVTLAKLKSRSLHPVIVWTHAGAGRARAFYEKCGFVLTGRERIETLFPIGLEAPEVEYSLSIL